MTVSLRPVTRENWLACAQLQVHPEQQGFVAPNAFSIAESRFYPQAEIRAIYDDETLVGFVMWGEDVDSNPGELWVWRLMVDARYQGQGHARATMGLLLEQWAREGAPAVYLSYAPANDGAARFYARLGFEQTGRVEGGEIVVRRDLAPIAPPQA